MQIDSFSKAKEYPVTNGCYFELTLMHCEKNIVIPKKKLTMRNVIIYLTVGNPLKMNRHLSECPREQERMDSTVKMSFVCLVSILSSIRPAMSAL